MSTNEHTFESLIAEAISLREQELAAMDDEALTNDDPDEALGQMARLACEGKPLPEPFAVAFGRYQYERGAAYMALEVETSWSMEYYDTAAARMAAAFELAVLNHVSSYNSHRADAWHAVRDLSNSIKAGF